MSELTIGNWVRRSRGKWHLVESVVAEDAVTRCGRRMDRVASRGELQVSEDMPLTRMIGQPQLCKAGCDREQATPHDIAVAFPLSDQPVPDAANLLDDDGSTHDESEPA